jgi:hypothetical protein
VIGNSTMRHLAATKTGPDTMADGATRQRITWTPLAGGPVRPLREVAEDAGSPPMVVTGAGPVTVAMRPWLA